jgi:hypothetical protein
LYGKPGGLELHEKPSGSSWLNNVEGYGTKLRACLIGRKWQSHEKVRHKMREEKIYQLIKIRGKGEGRYGWNWIVQYVYEKYMFEIKIKHFHVHR